MIITKQNLLDRKVQFNLNRFLKGKLPPDIYFKYFYEEPPPQTEFDFIKLPNINRTFMCIKYNNHTHEHKTKH